MTGQYTKIIAVDYNTIQQNIAAVLGVGGTNPLTNATDATFGYNQSVLSSQVTVNAKMSSNQWSNLRTDILKARQHQTGLSETLVDPTVSEKITEANRYAYGSMTNLAISDRTVTPPSSQSTLDTIATGTITTSWNNTNVHTVTMNFTDANAIKYFFNTGGAIKFSASRIGGTVSPKNSSWTSMLSDMGIISLQRLVTTASGFGTSYAVGGSSLTTTDTPIFQKYSDTVTYSANLYKISAKITAIPGQLVFTINFSDLSGNPNGIYGYDENIDGTLTSIVQVYRASGNNVSITAPTLVSSTFPVGAVVIPQEIYFATLTSDYSITTQINEGINIATVNVTTINVADRTMYWSTNAVTGTITTADFLALDTLTAKTTTGNNTTGSFSIINGIGSFIIRANADLFTEGSESFTITIRNTSTTGGVAYTTPSMIINDTSTTPPPEYSTLYSDSYVINEGNSVTLTLTTLYVTDNTTLYWTTNTITGNLTTADFIANANTTVNDNTSGSFKVTGNTGTILLTLANDVTTEGSDSFTITIRTGSVSGPGVITLQNVITVNDTSLAPVYKIANSYSFNEGTSITFTISTTNVPTGTNLYWSIFGDTPFAADLSAGTGAGGAQGGTGTFTISGNTGGFSLWAIADFLTEGAETFYVYIRTGSITGSIVLTSAAITIGDTSRFPLYNSVTPLVNNFNEGTSITVTVSTTDVPNGTVLYWTIAGVGISSTDLSQGASGSFSISNDTASFTLSAVADYFTEGAETFIVSIRTGSVSGTVVKQTTAITINDTSTTTNEVVSYAPTALNTGATSWSIYGGRPGDTGTVTYTGVTNHTVVFPLNSSGAYDGTVGVTAGVTGNMYASVYFAATGHTSQTFSIYWYNESFLVQSQPAAVTYGTAVPYVISKGIPNETYTIRDQANNVLVSARLDSSGQIPGAYVTIGYGNVYGVYTLTALFGSGQYRSGTITVLQPITISRIDVAGASRVLESASAATTFTYTVYGGIGQTVTFSGIVGTGSSLIATSPQQFNRTFSSLSAKTYPITVTCTGTTVTSVLSFTCYATVLVTCQRTGTNEGLWSDWWTITVYGGVENANLGIHLYGQSYSPSVPTKDLLGFGIYSGSTGYFTYTHQYFNSTNTAIGNYNYVMTDPAFGVSAYFTITG